MPRIIGFDEYLGLIAEQNLHVVLEHAVPRGSLKKEYATVRAADGRKVGFESSGGFSSTSIELPIDTLHEYLRKGFMRESENDAKGNTIYLITEEGLVCAKGNA
jgi:hypothetical protein